MNSLLDSNKNRLTPQSTENFKRTFESFIQAQWGVKFQSVEPFMVNSILHYDPMYKSICRVGEVLQKPELVMAEIFFSSETLLNIILRTDTVSFRDYLYFDRLKQECDFALPKALPDTAPWEDILRPLAQVKQNAENGTVVNPWILSALSLMIVLFVDSKGKESGHYIDYSFLVQHLSQCYSFGVEQAFVTAFQQMSQQNQAQLEGGTDE